MANDFKLVTLEPQNIISVRRVIPMAGYGDFVGPTIGRLYGVASEAGLTPAGGSLSLSYSPPTETIDAAAAITIKDDVAAVPAGLPADVKVETLPGGKAATVTYVGDYSGLPGVYRDMGDWIQQQGLTTRAAPWEEYVCGPECSEEQPCESCKNGPVTVINWPVS